MKIKKRFLAITVIPLIGALAELAQELSVESKIMPQHLGYREDILPMG